MHEGLLNFLQHQLGAWCTLVDPDSIDLDDFIRQTAYFPLTPVERVRQLAIFVERHGSTGDPSQDWAMLRRLYDFGATVDASDYSLWWSRGITATHLAEMEQDPAVQSELFAQGETACRRALELESDTAGIYYSLGINAYMNHGGAAGEAQKWFTEVLRREPGHAFARLYLGHCFQDGCHWQEALETYSGIEAGGIQDWPYWRRLKLQEQTAFCKLKCASRDEALKGFLQVLAAYETADADTAAELAAPDELVDVAVHQLRSELYDRTKAYVVRSGLAQRYRQHFESSEASPPGPEG